MKPDLTGLLFYYSGSFAIIVAMEDDRLGMIPAVFIPSLEIDGGYTHCTFTERLRIEKLALFKKARCIRNVHAVYTYIK